MTLGTRNDGQAKKPQEDKQEGGLQPIQGIRMSDQDHCDLGGDERMNGGVVVVQASCARSEDARMQGCKDARMRGCEDVIDR